ncbi:MAG: hypothetical protein QOG63_1112 [Thermoleophilaceae bacterium]|nr:hypothetical protein [Thermoleophilaceae bacterium]
MEIGIGTTIGGYRLDQLIGQGGMGVVYMGSSVESGARVAIKLLTPDLARQSGFRERFVREARYANSLRHPNVIEVYDAGEQDGVLYIVMQYIEGTDLKNLFARDGALAPDRTVSLLGQVASALDAAHAQGLLHRDIKPGNIMIQPASSPGEPEHCYLADFGLSKNVSSDSIALTAQGEFVGTIDYTAPELVLGKQADSRLDVYSLGCLFYECLAGQPPFNKERDVEVLYAHIQDPPPKITAMRGDVPAALDDVIAKAMAKKPDDRYETCRAFIDAARAALGAPPPPPVPDPLPPPPAPPVDMPAPPAPPPMGPPLGQPPPPPPGPPVGPPIAHQPPAPPAPPAPAMPPPPPPGDPASAPFPGDALVLRVTGGNAMGSVIQVDDEFLIGRQAPGDGKLGNDIEISRRHARITREADGRFVIEDLGSTNGTYVNGERVASRALNPHDVIEMGDTRVLVLHPREAPSLDEPAAPAPPPGVTTFASVPADITADLGPPAAPPEPVADAEPAEAAEPVAEAAEAAEPVAEAEPAEAAEPAEPAAPEPPGAVEPAEPPEPEPAAAAEPAAPEPESPEAAEPPVPAPPQPVEDATPPPQPVLDATPAPQPVLDPTPAPQPNLDATPAPQPVLDVTPPPQAVPEPPPEPEPAAAEPEAAAAEPEPEPEPELDLEPVPEPPSPEPEPAPVPHRAVHVGLAIDPTTGELVVEIDDPEGPVRVVKRGGTWTIDES